MFEKGLDSCPQLSHCKERLRVHSQLLHRIRPELMGWNFQGWRSSLDIRKSFLTVKSYQLLHRKCFLPFQTEVESGFRWILQYPVHWTWWQPIQHWFCHSVMAFFPKSKTGRRSLLVASEQQTERRMSFLLLLESLWGIHNGGSSWKAESQWIRVF